MVAVIAFGEGESFGVPVAVVVDDDALCGEGPSRQLLGFEGIHRDEGMPAVPSLCTDLRLDAEHGHVVGHLAGSLVDLLELGDLHVHVEVEEFELVAMPADKAAVGGFHEVLRGLEGHFKLRLRLHKGEVAEQRYRS